MEVKDTNKIITTSPNYVEVRGGVISFNERTGEIKASVEVKGNADNADLMFFSFGSDAGALSYINSSGATVTDTFSGGSFNNSSQVFTGSDERKRVEFSRVPTKNTSTGVSNDCVAMVDYGEVTLFITVVAGGTVKSEHKISLDLNPVKHKVTMLSDDIDHDTTPDYKFTIDDLPEIQSLYPAITTSVSTETNCRITTDYGSYLLGGNRLIFVNGRKLDDTNRTPMTGTNPVTYMSEIKYLEILTHPVSGVLPLGDNNYTLNLHCEDI